jgi:acyl carrier protein
MSESNNIPELERFPEMIVFAVQYLELDIDPVKAEGETLAALGIDSLELLSLTGALEETFGVTFDPDRLQDAGHKGRALSLGETLRLMASRE